MAIANQERDPFAKVTGVYRDYLAGYDDPVIGLLNKSDNQADEIARLRGVIGKLRSELNDDQRFIKKYATTPAGGVKENAIKDAKLLDIERLLSATLNDGSYDF